MKTTEEKNRMIAEFMGYEFDIENKCEIIEDFDIVENIQTYEVEGGIRIVEGGYVITRFLPEQMRYHTSWDWLMPVVDKIEVLSFYVDIYSINAATASKCQISKHSEDKVISSAVSYNKKEAVYESVIQFIEWYNENK